MNGKRKRTEKGKIGKRDAKREKRETRMEEKKEGRIGDEGFRCGICLEIMCWEREPRILPCGHSFCSDCLKKLLLHQSSSSSSSSSHSDERERTAEEKKNENPCCPYCREEFKCESVESLDENYLIPETIDTLVSSEVLSLSSKPEEGECINFGSCHQKSPMYCSKCEAYICDSCDSIHSSNIFTQNHKRQPRLTTSHPMSGKVTNSKKPCPKHPSEFISGYCFECSDFVCLSCVFDLRHSRHKECVSPLTESAKLRRYEVAKIGFILKKRMKEVTKLQEQNDEEVKILKTKLVKKESEKKDLALEMDDLRMRHDTIDRLSETPTDESIFDEIVFSTLLQTANELVREARSGVITPKNQPGVVSRAGVELQTFFNCDETPRGMSVNGDGNLLISERNSMLTLRERNGTFIRTIGSSETFKNPIGVATGPNEQVVVLDYSKCQVIIFDNFGKKIGSFGSEGSDPAQFMCPWGVVVDGLSRIIVADSGNHRIQIFQSDGSFIRCFGTKGSSEGQFRSPSGVSVDRDGNLVVSDYGNHRIQVFTIEGKLIRTFGSIRTKRNPQTELRFPEGISVDGGGRIIVADSENKRVCVFEEDGSFLYSFGSGQLEEPCGVLVDSFGSIFVSDLENNVVQVWK